MTNAREGHDNRVPVTIIGGYLGAGKTTLLNRLLRQQSSSRIAVLVNEFGEIGIDADLIVGCAERLVTLSNGCLCCTVRGDLLEAAKQVLAEHPDIERLVVETSGLADPGPVAQTFLSSSALSDRLWLESLVVLVDASFSVDRMSQVPELRRQITYADHIVLTKCDIAPRTQVEEWQLTVERRNPEARIWELHDSELPEGLLALSPTQVIVQQPERYLAAWANRRHDPEVQSEALTTNEELDPSRFIAWMTAVALRDGASLNRWKGIVALKGYDASVIVQGVHSSTSTEFGRTWAPDEQRMSKLVFIGKAINFGRLKTEFQNCAA